MREWEWHQWARESLRSLPADRGAVAAAVAWASLYPACREWAQARAGRRPLHELLRESNER